MMNTVHWVTIRTDFVHWMDFRLHIQSTKIVSPSLLEKEKYAYLQFTHLQQPTKIVFGAHQTDIKV
jgi:hypothetical protein